MKMKVQRTFLLRISEDVEFALVAESSHGHAG